jgi:hypothetical protein
MSDRLLVATRKGLFKVERGEGENGGGAWRVTGASFLGDPVKMVLPDPRDGAIYAALGHGHFGVKLHRSRDGGESWEEISSPKYPEKPADVDDRDPMRGTPIPWVVDQIWALEAGGAEEPGVLWCGTIPGGLFRSADGGASWSLVSSLWNNPARKEWFGGGYDYPGIHSICVDPRDPKHVTVGISCGGVWVTRDAGETWQVQADGMVAGYMPPEQANNPNIQDPHRIVACPAAPDVLWSQHHSSVFRSTDGARSWSEVTAAAPSRFGFAVAVHPKDPDVAWFVPAVADEKRIPVDGKFVVSRTRDGGKTFDVLRKGLPQEHAYDLVYRHALDVDGTGQRLAVGSTTGSVWTSDDQGDSWQVVSHTLPPVYCVRFIPSA